MSFKEYETKHHAIANEIEGENTEEIWARELSADLTSERFAQAMQKFPSGFRPDATALAIQHRIIHRDGYKFWDFIESDSPSMTAIIKLVAEKLNLSDLEQVENKKKIFDYCTKLYRDNGYFFHGFNGSFEADIREHGLSTEKRQWEWSEIKEIADIGKKAGYIMILGWGDLNSQGRTFLDKSPRHLYRYATASPEWFAQFTSEGFYHKNRPEVKEAFYRRDYEQARKNIEDLCNRMMASKEEDIQAGRAYPNITESERQTILNFFEKYWRKFTGSNSQPKAALIKRSKLQALSSGLQSFEEFCTDGNIDPNSVNVYSLVQDSLEIPDAYGIDVSVNRDIRSHDLVIVDLPEYNHLYPRQDEKN